MCVCVCVRACMSACVRAYVCVCLQALEMVGCILWGPTMSHGSLGLDRGVTADGWLRKRQLEVLVGFAGAYACPAGGQQVSVLS